MKPVLRIIVGTTASGKERLALAVAERLNGEIISVDSMKVYRKLNIATAKAGADERLRVRHHCLDLVEPEQTFSAADFVREAEAAIADMTVRGKTPILSGGTAFYYKALLEGLFEGPGADPDFRAGLEARAAREGGEALHRELAERDQAAAAKIHPADIRRLVRALEVLHLTGGNISERQTQWAQFHSPDRAERAAAFFAQPRHPFIMVRIERSREDTHARVRDRIRRMEQAGLEEEARMVYAMRDTISRTPLQAVGYKEFFPYFQGQESWQQALEKLAFATNRLVRSQDTWFRKFPAEVLTMTHDDTVEAVADRLAGGVFAGMER